MSNNCIVKLIYNKYLYTPVVYIGIIDFYHQDGNFIDDREMA